MSYAGVSQKGTSLKGPTYCWELISVSFITHLVTCHYLGGNPSVRFMDMWIRNISLNLVSLMFKIFIEMIYLKCSFKGSAFSTVLHGFTVCISCKCSKNLGKNINCQIQRTEHWEFSFISICKTTC